MKRAAFLLGLAVVTPGIARGQVPTASPAPAATPPAAAPATTPPAAPAATPPAAPAATEPTPKGPPGDEYYVEPTPGAHTTSKEPTPPPPAGAPKAPSQPPPFEPPPPPFFEPPPPPAVWHLTPQTSLWVGARVGWFFPFGNLFARAVPLSNGGGYVLQGVPWRDYAGPGPTFELDAGVRLSRSYTAFVLWERAQLSSGHNNATLDGQQDGAESDFWAVGLRASSNPDHTGFLTEVAIGYRRARTFFKNDVEYQFTDAPFEARLGLGAELRFSRAFSMSVLGTVGVGGFGSLERVAPNGYASSLSTGSDAGDGHAWATLMLGGHFDLLRSQH